MIKSFIKIAPFAFASLAFFNANAKTEKYTLDPFHTNITWSANHFGFSNPNGKFAKSQGEINLDEKNPAKSSVKVTIDTTSIVTGIEAFDNHLKSKDFFNVEKFKTAIFESTKVVLEGDKKAKIHGNLTLLGVTKPVVIQATFNKIGENPFSKNKTVGFSGETIIKRSEFGMSYAISGVSDDVKLTLEVEAFVESKSKTAASK